MSLFPKDLGQAHARLVLCAALALVTAGSIAGCGAGYRPVVTPITPTGPASQPASNVLVISAPSPTAQGIATVANYSGDTVMATAPVGPGPITFTVDETGSTGYSFNSDGTVTNLPVTNQLQAKNITFTTLPSTAQPVNMFSPSAGLWIADLNGSVVD